MKSLLHPSYIPNIATFALIAQREIVWEVEDNFQKQTFRNRAFICADRGKLMFTIPIKHVGGNLGRQKYKDVSIDNNYKWQRQHWRTLQTAYRSSPFFEYYEDDIAPLFEEKNDSLLAYNLKTIAVICECLQIEMSLARTETYHVEPSDINDARFMVRAKKETAFELPVYNQVFGDRHGYLKNMSILDLLFNEGPSALTYLRNINLECIDE